MGKQLVYAQQIVNTHERKSNRGGVGQDQTGRIKYEWICQIVGGFQLPLIHKLLEINVTHVGNISRFVLKQSLIIHIICIPNKHKEHNL